MSYAASTFIGEKRLYLGAGIVWATIVFLIDRAIVSTFRKRQTIGQDVVSIPFILRLGLAVLVGFVVAHPLVMFIFSNSIEVQLDERRRNDLQRISTPYNNQIHDIEQKKVTLDQSISSVRTKKDDELKERETALIQTIGRWRWYGRRANEIRKIRTRLLDERKQAIQQLDDEKKDLNTKVGEVETARNQALDGYRQSRDYLARENAFTDLTAANDLVRWTQRLIIFLFVFVDILPISLKVATKKEAYDFLLEDFNKRAIDESQAETKAHAEMLKNISDQQKPKVAQIIASKFGSAEFTAALEAQVDAFLKRSVGSSTVAIPTNPVSTTVMEPSAGNGHNKATGLSGRLKSRLEDKGLDATISLICIPPQALVLFGFYMYFGSDIWQYVSWSTTLQIFPLFFFNFISNRFLKLFID